MYLPRRGHEITGDYQCPSNHHGLRRTLPELEFHHQIHRNSAKQDGTLVGEHGFVTRQAEEAVAGTRRRGFVTGSQMLEKRYRAKKLQMCQHSGIRKSNMSPLIFVVCVL